jgi:FKBP-type peptidyl-prolyl cis-trans isomerase
MVTDSGLQYIIVEEGTGARPSADSRVQVHYTGTLIDGTKFDSSYDRGAPAEFPLQGVIPAWTEAVQLMKVGGKIKIFSPPDIAYGERGAPPVIGPNATLIFDIELIDIVE